MTKSEMTSAILEARRRLGLSWTDIAKAVGLSPVFVTSTCFGMNTLSQTAADKLCSTALIHEKFGDGIMSAIDIDMDIDRVGDPKGDRVKITMTGKFLSYKSW